MASPGQGREASYSEREIIALLSRRVAAHGNVVSTGIGDDAAVLKLPGTSGLSQVVTTDLLVEGIHFDRRYMGPADIGYKALAVNLSDIAAMGAEPAAAFGCLGLPPGFTKADADALLDGVAAACEDGGVSLAGGDTVAAHQLLIGFTVLGTVAGAPLLRSGARPGDLLWHSGSLGLSEAGRLLLASGQPCPEEMSTAHLRPRAQLELGRWLQQQGLATACIDLSDSLSQCLLQLAEASGVGLELDFRDYAFHSGLSDAVARLSTTGGTQAGLSGFLLAAAEDYQLLFTTDPGKRQFLMDNASVPVSLLGTVAEKDTGLYFTDERGNRTGLDESGWKHPH